MNQDVDTTCLFKYGLTIGGVTGDHDRLVVCNDAKPKRRRDGAVRHRKGLNREIVFFEHYARLYLGGFDPIALWLLNRLIARQANREVWRQHLLNAPRQISQS